MFSSTCCLVSRQSSGDMDMVFVIFTPANNPMARPTPRQTKLNSIILFIPKASYNRNDRTVNIHGWSYKIGGNDGRRANNEENGIACRSLTLITPARFPIQALSLGH